MSEERSVFADPADGLCWLTECTLATIEHMELMRRPPKGELGRQQRMAETAIGSLKALTEKKLGRPAPAVPKAKRSLYLDVQVWFALKVLAQKTEDGSVSSIANQLLRQALSLDT